MSGERLPTSFSPTARPASSRITRSRARRPDPSLSVHRGVPLLLERAGVGPGDVELIVHGTTLLLNAIIQHRGAKVALVVSKGHRGIIEIARARLPNSYSFRVRKEEPLVSRDLVFETGARIMFDGTVIGRPEPGEIEAIAKGIKAAQAEAVTVLLLHSYAHTEMEAQVGAELRRHLPGIPVTESARVWPERREFERSQIAVMNAFSQPLFQTYLALLAERVRDIGVTAPIYITANNGGTLSIDSARERPIDTVLSGPASGVVAANRTTRASGHAKIITVDMGGTSCDVGVTKGLEPEFSMQTHVGNYPLAMPVVGRLLDWRRGRLRGVGRRAGHPQGRSAQRRRRSGPAMLRARGQGTDDHRLLLAGWPDQSGPLPGWPHEAERRSRPLGARGDRRQDWNRRPGSGGQGGGGGPSAWRPPPCRRNCSRRWRGVARIPESSP